MKKLSVLMSMFLAIGLFSACSNDENEIVMNGNSDGDVTNLISPIDKGDGYDEISSFFNSEFSSTGSNVFLVGLDKDEDQYRIIKSREELKAIYSGDKELPEIDFQQYTLIMGWKVFPEGGHVLFGQQAISISEDLLMINLYVNHLDAGYCVLEEICFWALYPKCQAKEVSINVVEVEE